MILVLTKSRRGPRGRSLNNARIMRTRVG